MWMYVLAFCIASKHTKKIGNEFEIRWEVIANDEQDEPEMIRKQCLDHQNDRES